MKKAIVALLVAVLVIALVPPVTLARPDKDKPVPATDVELVKKVTLRGRPQGGKPSRYAATGELGLGAGANKYAILVGISDYPGEGNSLEFADDDAIAMNRTLVEDYGYAPENIRLLTEIEQTSRTDIMNAIDETDVACDELVFLFSGHGARGRAMDDDEEKWDEAIITHDSINLVPIWDGELAQRFSAFPAATVFLFFDSCLAGGMTDLKGPGRVINMATTERGLAYESEDWGGGHGQFSYYFVVEGMSEGEANVHDYGLPWIPGQATVEEAYDYAKANCKWQKPTINDSFDDDLLL